MLFFLPNKIENQIMFILGLICITIGLLVYFIPFVRTKLWEHTEATIYKFKLVGNRRSHGTIFYVYYSDSEGNNRQGECKIDNIFNEKYYNKKRNNEKVEIAYHPNKKQVIFIDEKETIALTVCLLLFGALSTFLAFK